MVFPTILGEWTSEKECFMKLFTAGYLSNIEKHLVVCLGYIGDYTTYPYRDYNKPL